MPEPTPAKAKKATKKQAATKSYRAMRHVTLLDGDDEVQFYQGDPITLPVPRATKWLARGDIEEMS